MEGASCLLITLERLVVVHWLVPTYRVRNSMPDRASDRNFLPGSYRNVLVWAATSFTTYFRPPLTFRGTLCLV